MYASYICNLPSENKYFKIIVINYLKKIPNCWHRWNILEKPKSIFLFFHQKIERAYFSHVMVAISHTYFLVNKILLTLLLFKLGKLGYKLHDKTNTKPYEFDRDYCSMAKLRFPFHPIEKQLLEKQLSKEKQVGKDWSTLDPLETLPCFCLPWFFPFHHTWIPSQETNW